MLRILPAGIEAFKAIIRRPGPGEPIAPSAPLRPLQTRYMGGLLAGDNVW